MGSLQSLILFLYHNIIISNTQTYPMRINLKLLASVVGGSLMLLAASCTDGVSDESWSPAVHGAQLSSPQIDKSCFSSVTMADGSENVKFTWPLVEGAGGYKVNVGLVNAGAIEPIIIDSIVDGLTLLFPKYEDSNYEVSVQTLANDKLNNTAAQQATTYSYSTMIEAINVPVGTDVAEFINGYIASNEASLLAAYADDPSNYELAFELEAGKQYTLNAPADSRTLPVTLRSGDKNNHAIVTVGPDGYLTNQGGLRVKFIAFDCTQMKAKGLLMLGEEVPELSTEALGYKALGGNQDCWVIEKQVMFKTCEIKNLANAVINSDNHNWALNDFRIDDCLIQLCNEGTTSIIDLCASSSSKGGIKDLTVKNTSFVNLLDNEKAYFIRLANASNAQAQKIWGPGNRNSCTLQNITFVKCMSNKNFSDRYINSASVCDMVVKGCIFYDTWRIQKLIGNNQHSIKPEDNTIWGITNEVDATDASKFATEEDPQFAGPVLQELDLTKPNGGLNLRPAAPIASGKKMGDPRWF